jgi:hypothetical protein
MSGPNGNRHRARRRHLRLCAEDVWGQCPDEPVWRAVPVLGDGYTLKATHEHFRPDSEYGGSRRSVHLRSLHQVVGRLVTRAWPELADALLAMALERTAGELGSYCADYYTPADPRRCVGAMVDRFRLDASAPDGELRLRYDLRARSEEANPELAEEDFDYSGISPVPFAFDRATVLLDGAAVTGAERFRLRVDNRLSAGPNRASFIAFLTARRRAVSVELTKPDDGDALNEAIRSGGTLSLVVSLTHPQGHSLTLQLPSIHVEAADQRADAGELATSVLRMEAGTDGEGDDVVYQVDLKT